MFEVVITLEDTGTLPITEVAHFFSPQQFKQAQCVEMQLIYT